MCQLTLSLCSNQLHVNFDIPIHYRYQLPIESGDFVNCYTPPPKLFVKIDNSVKFSVSFLCLICLLINTFGNSG